MTKVRSNDGSMIDDRRGQGGGGGGMGGGLGGLLDSLRRGGMGGGGGGMGGGGMGGGLPGGLKAGGGMMMIIMVLAALFLPKLLGAGGNRLASADPETAPSGAETCDDENEAILCGATIDVQNYWVEALPKFFGTDYVVTKTVFFDGATNTACGQASSQVGPFYCPADQLIYFDLTFLPALEEQLIGKSTDLAQQYIVAHEYGHHVQNVLGTSDQVNRAREQDPGRANQYSVALELQADCFAGVWVRDAYDRGLLDNPDEIQEALDAAEGVGDDRIQQKTQGRIDPEAWTHGSAEQRQYWFTRGFNDADPRRCNTFDEVL